MASEADSLLRTWKLSSFYTEDVDTKQRSYSFGEHPIGFIAFAAERFFALITADERKAPRSAQAVAYPTIIAYTGNLDGNRFVTTVDAGINSAMGRH